MQSFFTLSWLLTWFSHNLERLGDIARIFDFLLASHPIMPVYLAAALITTVRQQLLALPCEMTAIHTFFQNVPEPLELDILIESAQRMSAKYSAAELVRLSGVEIPEE